MNSPTTKTLKPTKLLRKVTLSITTKFAAYM